MRVQISYAQALIVIALVALSVASKATTESRSEGVAHTPVVMKRMLRSHADTTVTDDTSTSEERSTIAELVSCVTEFSPLVMKKIQDVLLWLMKSTPTEEDAVKMLNGMKLDDPEFVNTEAFSDWVNIMQSIYVEPPEKATAMIFEMLDKKLTDVRLAWMIHKAIESETMLPLMMDLRQAQFEKWLNQEATQEGVKSLLQAGVESDSGPERDVINQIAVQFKEFHGEVTNSMKEPAPASSLQLMKKTPREMLDGMELSDPMRPTFVNTEAFSDWVSIMQSIYVEPPEKATAMIFEMLDEKLTDVPLAWMIHKAIESDTMKPLMMDLRQAQFEKWAKEEDQVKVKSRLHKGTESDSDPADDVYNQIEYRYDKFFGKQPARVKPIASQHGGQLRIAG